MARTATNRRRVVPVFDVFAGYHFCGHTCTLARWIERPAHKVLERRSLGLTDFWNSPKDSIGKVGGCRFDMMCKQQPFFINHRLVLGSRLSCFVRRGLTAKFATFLVLRKVHIVESDATATGWERCRSGKGVRHRDCRMVHN